MVETTSVETTRVETTRVETTTASCHPPSPATHAAPANRSASFCPPHDTSIPGSSVPTLPKYLPPPLREKRLIQAKPPPTSLPAHPKRPGGWLVLTVPMQARTSHHSTARHGSLRMPAPAHPAPGCPRLVPMVPSLSPRPSPQPEEAEHLQAAAKGRLARWRNVRTPARARPAPGAGVKARGWRRALGRGQRTPPRFLKYSHAQLFLKVALGKSALRLENGRRSGGLHLGQCYAAGAKVRGRRQSRGWRREAPTRRQRLRGAGSGGFPFISPWRQRPGSPPQPQASPLLPPRHPSEGQGGAQRVPQPPRYRRHRVSTRVSPPHA